MIEFIPSIILCYPLSPIAGIVLTGLIFPFSYMGKQYFYHIHSFTLSLYPPHSTGADTQDLFYLLVLSL
jgi:hypothetical protein